MTIAEIHGKLAPQRPDGCTERMEDLLTSDVFGSMRYVTGGCGFMDWLRSSESPLFVWPHAPMPSPFPPSGVRRIHFRFWPPLPNGREADVALVLELDEEAWVIVVEAKYFSGTSDYEPMEQVDDSRTGNQLADQMLALAELSDKDIRQLVASKQLPPVICRVHLFVTADYCLPTPVYQQTRRVLETRRGLADSWPVGVRWLSWRSLAQHLEPCLSETDLGRRAVVEDLLKLLRRKELVPFSGFREIPWMSPTDPHFWGWWNLDALPQLGEPNFWKGGE